jgi:signal transduction histidine kinase/ActR/RegA family two-component response regulator
MNPDDEFQRTFSDICVLFELALSVGQSLELRENCERFLTTLMARKNLGYAAVWLREDLLPRRGNGEVLSPEFPRLFTRTPPPFRPPPASKDLTLVYGVPRIHVRERLLPKDQPGFVAAGQQPVSVAAGDAAFGDFVTEQGIDGGVYAVFPLGRLGFLKLHSAVRTAPLTEAELSQLETVVRKFTVSLDGCIAHERAVEEVSERERAEREREAMREQLQLSQKMEAIGRLAGGVAHDFNNLLTTIRGHTELLRRNTLVDAPTRIDLDAILTASDRAAELTGQLLAFSRRGKLRAEQVELDKLIEEVTRLLRHTVDPRIEVRSELGLDGAVVAGDPSRLQSALLNLAVNARDAMPEGGQLVFSTRVVGPEDPARPGELPAGPPLAEIRVADTGMGMAPEVARRVFEPFFTTKEMGRGTGLGLAAVYGTVRSHGGSIVVDSAPGLGSLFRIYLPLVGQHGAATATVTPERAWIEGRGTVLLVDDQAEVRDVTGSILDRLGYTVITAEDGVAALARYAQHSQSIRLVLLDVRMPRMDGAETLRRLRKLAPALPVVIVSGFGADKDLATIRAMGVQGVVEKPFTVSELSETMARALGARCP